jgi:hypothetical protein
MQSYEYFLINKHFPPLNIKSKDLIEPFQFSEPKWLEYHAPINPKIKSPVKPAAQIAGLSLHSCSTVIPANLLFPQLNKAIHYKVLGAYILLHRAYKIAKPTILDILNICNMTKRGGNYSIVREALSHLYQIQTLFSDVGELKYDPFKNLDDQDLLLMLRSKVSKWEWLFLELILKHQYQNIMIPIDDIKLLSGYTQTKDIMSRIIPKHFTYLSSKIITFSPIYIGKSIANIYITITNKE